MNRRGFLGAILAAVTAPAIIRTPGILMPVRAIAVPQFPQVVYDGVITINFFDELTFREEFLRAFDRDARLLIDSSLLTSA